MNAVKCRNTKIPLYTGRRILMNENHKTFDRHILKMHAFRKTTLSLKFTLAELSVSVISPHLK